VRVWKAATATTKPTRPADKKHHTLPACLRSPQAPRPPRRGAFYCPDFSAAFPSPPRLASQRSPTPPPPPRPPPNTPPPRFLPILFVLLILSPSPHLPAQLANPPLTPDSREIPIPPITTSLIPLPAPDALRLRPELPDILLSENGTRITSAAQWPARRAKLRELLTYYATGAIPPAPGNVRGRELKSATLLDGTVHYRLIHLSFGPGEKLGFDIAVFVLGVGVALPAVAAWLAGGGHLDALALVWIALVVGVGGCRPARGSTGIRAVEAVAASRGRADSAPLRAGSLLARTCAWPTSPR